jgi:hypothetical protein
MDMGNYTSQPAWPMTQFALHESLLIHVGRALNNPPDEFIECEQY